MAILPGILAWRIPWTQEPGGVQSPQGHRLGHDRSDFTHTHTRTHTHTHTRTHTHTKVLVLSVAWYALDPKDT